MHPHSDDTHTFRKEIKQNINNFWGDFKLELKELKIMPIGLSLGN